ncbi:putative ABC transporter ATP-binding protein [Candidatus Burkholderia humilis]|nr:putative ABC transporter ATP-binding protein [Candidatus Burkholderia humilis]
MGHRDMDATLIAPSSVATRQLVRIDGLHKSFGSHHVLKGIDLDVMPGQKVSLIGPSGSGKTALLRCVNYLETPSARHVLIDGTASGARASAGSRCPGANSPPYARTSAWCSSASISFRT